MRRDRQKNSVGCPLFNTKNNVKGIKSAGRFNVKKKTTENKVQSRQKQFKIDRAKIKPEISAKQKYTK